jgi:hypothetical protein
MLFPIRFGANGKTAVRIGRLRKLQRAWTHLARPNCKEARRTRSNAVWRVFLRARRDAASLTHSQGGETGRGPLLERPARSRSANAGAFRGFPSKPLFTADRFW